MDKILYHPTPGTTGFFLMKDVMKEPSEKDYSGDQWKEYDAHVNYGFHIEERKEEAIKNGEITNIDLLPIIERSTHEVVFIHVFGDERLRLGDMFDVPEGLEFVKGLVNGKNYVRLVPSKKEEMSYADKRKGVRKKSDWLKQCLKDGWTKDQLDGLSDLWDKYKDEVGNLKPESKSESQEALYTKDELIDAISAYSICPSDFTVEETKKDFPHQFKGKREHVTKWLKDNFTITRNSK